MRLSEPLKGAGLTLCTKYCGITLLGRMDVPEGWISLLHPSKQGILKVPWEMPFWTAQKEHSYDGNCGWDQCWKLQQDLLLPCLFPSPSQNLFPLSMFCEHLFSLSSGGVTTYGLTKKSIQNCFVPLSPPWAQQVLPSGLLSIKLILQLCCPASISTSSLHRCWARWVSAKPQNLPNKYQPFVKVKWICKRFRAVGGSVLAVEFLSSYKQ